MLSNVKKNGGRLITFLLVLVLVFQMIPLSAASANEGSGTIKPNVTLESSILYGDSVSNTDQIPAGDKFTLVLTYSFLPLGTDNTGVGLVYENPILKVQVPKDAVIDKIVYDNNTDIDQTRPPEVLPAVGNSKMVHFYLTPALAGEKKQVSVVMYYENQVTPNNTACTIKPTLEGSFTYVDGTPAGTFSVPANTQNLNIVATEPWVVTKETGSMTTNSPSNYKANPINPDTVDKEGSDYVVTYRITVKHDSASANYDRTGRLNFLDYALTDIFPIGYPAGGGGKIDSIRMKDPGQNDATVPLKEGTDYTVEQAGDGSTKSVTITSYAQQPADATKIKKGAPVESVYYVKVKYPVAPYVYATNVDPADHIFTLKNTAQLSYTLVGNENGNKEANASIKLGEVETMKDKWPFAITKYIKIGDGASQYYNVLDENAQAAYGTARFWLTMDAAGNIPARNIYNQPVMTSYTDIGADGRLVFADMREGEYWLHEKVTPSGFAGLTSALKITITADGKVIRGDDPAKTELDPMTGIKIDNVLSESDLGIIHFTKKGVNPFGETVAMEGVTFQLISKSTNQVVKTAITDAQGYVAFHAVPEGDYIIREISVSEELEKAGFEATPLNIEVTAVKNKVVEVKSSGYDNVMNFSPYGSFKIKKTDTSGNLLTGAGVTEAVFALYDSNKTLITIGPDGKNYSSITVKNTAEGYVSGRLAPGTYYLKETKAPNGYELSNEFIEVVVQPYTLVETVVKNKALAKLGILKYGKWGGTSDYEGLEGIDFKVYDAKTGGEPLKNANGEVIIFTTVTDATGKPALYDKNNNDTTAIKVLPGDKTYYLEEVASTVPAGYIPLSERIEVHVPEGQVTELEVFNDPNYGRIRLTKRETNATTGKLMGAVEFQFYKADTYSEDANGNPTSQPVYKTSTNNVGVALSILLEPGKSYYIFEVTPKGYKPAGGAYKSMDPNGVLSTNTPGVHGGVTYSAITIPPAGSTDMELKVTAVNEPLVGITIIKTESTLKNGATTYVRAQFALYDRNPANLLTDEDKAAALVETAWVPASSTGYTFTGLVPGKSYWYVELQTSVAGYYFSSEPVEVKAPQTGETTPKKVTVTNDRSGTLKIYKTGEYDYGDGKGEKTVKLEGAQFDVFPDLTGDWEADYETAKKETRTEYQVKQTTLSDANGIATAAGLKPGYYYWIVETKAPDGYKPSATHFRTDKMVLSGDNVQGYSRDITHAEILNAPEKGILKFKKVNVNDKKVGVSATFKLYPEDPENPGTYPRDDSKAITITTDGTTGIGVSPWLDPGKYELVETGVDSGYLLDSAKNTRKIVIEAGKTLDLTLSESNYFTNQPKGRIKITKTATWKGVAAGTNFVDYLNEAVFEVYPKLSNPDMNDPVAVAAAAANDRTQAVTDKTLVEGLTTGQGTPYEKGVVYSPYLKPGDYWVYETDSPDDEQYIKSDKYYAVNVPGNEVAPVDNIGKVTVDNEPKSGMIRVLKLEMGTNIPLNDAYFELYEEVAPNTSGAAEVEVEPGTKVWLKIVPNTGDIISGTELDAEGNKIAGRDVTIPLDTDKTYYLKETAEPPGGYVMEQQWYGPITVEDGKITQQTVYNYKPNNPGVGKVDSQGNAVSGAYFGVFETKAAAELANRIVSDAANAATIAGETTEATLLSEAFWESLKITENSVQVTMDVFQVRKSVNGRLEFTGLASKNYYVMELKAPENYTRTSEIKDLIYNAEKGEFNSISFVNDEYGWIQVSKYTNLSGTDYRLPGATFEIYKAKMVDTDINTDSGGHVCDNSCNYEIADLTPVTTRVTSSTGDIGAFITGRLPSGHYIVKETEAPDGFQLDAANIYHVYVAPGGTNKDLYYSNDNPTGIKIQNKPLVGRFEFSKKDAHTGALIAATFKLQKRVGGVWVDQTDEKGNAFFNTIAGQVYLSDFLEPGEYQIVEIAVDGSYTKDDTVVGPFQIEAGEVRKGLEKVNVKKGNLTFTKYTHFNNEQTGNVPKYGTLAGAKFELYAVQSGDSANGTTLTAEERLEVLKRTADAFGVSNSQGAVSITGIDANADLNGTVYSKDYWLIEVEPDDPTVIAGYNPAAFTARKVTILANDTVNLDTKAADNVVNVPVWGKLKIRKVDKNAPTTGLAGAEFTVHKNPDCSDAAVATIKTVAGGYGETGLIAPGTYYLKEITMPGGYTNQGSKIYTGPGGNGYTVEANSYNAAGAEYVIENIKLQKIVVTKTSDAAGNPVVEGVTFELYSQNPAPIISSGGDLSGIRVGTPQITGSDGKATFENLMPNTKYWLRETIVPERIVLNPEIVEVTTDNSGEVQLTRTNERMGKIAVTKVARYTDINSELGYVEVALDEIYFEIRKTTGKDVPATGNAIETIGTSAGYAVSGWLEPGWYELTELSTSPGLGNDYVIDKAKHYVLLESGQEPNTDLSDTPIVNRAVKGRFRVEKFAQVGDEKVMLENAEFALYVKNAEGKYVPVELGSNNIFRTGTDGTYLSGPLPKGEYMFKETTAPVLKDEEGKIIAEYTLDDTTEYTFTIVDEAVVTREVRNYAKASLLLTKKADASNGNVLLNGAVFQLYWKDTDQPVEGFGQMVTGTNGVTAGDGTILWEGLDAGKYYVKEISAPTGYKADVQTIDVSVAQSGSPYQYEITATNTSTAGRILVKKIDANTGAALSGARFEVYEDNGGVAADDSIGVSFVTDASGFALSPLIELDLKNGETYKKYWVKETRAPAGYILDDQLQSIWREIDVYPVQTPVTPENGEEGVNYLIYKNVKQDNLTGFANGIVKTIKQTGGEVDPQSPYRIDTDKFKHGLMQGDVQLTFGLQGYATGTNPLPYKTFSVTDMKVGMQYKDASGYVTQPIVAGDYTIDKVKIFGARDDEGNPINATVQYQTYAQLGTVNWSSFTAGSVTGLQNLPVSGVLGYETVDMTNLPNGDIAMAVRVNYINAGTKFVAYGIDMDVTFKQRVGGEGVREIQRINNFGDLSYSYMLQGSEEANAEEIKVTHTSNEVVAFLPTQDVAKTVVEVTNKITKPTENYVFYPGRDMSITTVATNKSAEIPYIAPEVAIDLPAWTILKNATNPDAVIVTMYDSSTDSYIDLVQGVDYFVKMDEYVQATELDAGGNPQLIYESDGVTPVMVRRMSFVFPDRELQPNDNITFLYEATVSSRMPYYINKLTSNAYASSGHKFPITVENPLGTSYVEAPGMGSMKTNTDLDTAMDGLYTQAGKGSEKPGANMYIDAHDTATVGVSNDLSVRKEVKGPYDTDFKDPGDAAYVLPAGEYEYRLTITNNSDIDVEKLRFVDILPFLGDTYVARNVNNDSLNPRKTEVPTRPTLVSVEPSSTNDPNVSVYYYEDASGTRWTVDKRKEYTPKTDLPMLYLQDTGTWASNDWIPAGSESNLADVTAVGIDVVFEKGKYLEANGGTYSIILKMKAPGFTAENVLDYYDKMLANSVAVSILQEGSVDDVNFPTPIENNEVISYMRLPTGTIGDYVFWDKDNDGLQTQDPTVDFSDPDNPVENPLGGVGVTLYQYKYIAGQAGHETLEYHTTTDGNGYYEFTDLPCNMVSSPEYEGSENPEHYVGGVYYKYKLVFEQPSVGTEKLGPTHQKVGDDPTIDSDIDLNYSIDNILLNVIEQAGGVLVGETNMTLDAGFTTTEKLGNRVWFDANKNGIQDEDEVGVNDVTVNLYRVIDGKVEEKIYRTTKTANGENLETEKDEDGMYLFDDLVLGEYVVEFDISDLTKDDGYTYRYAFTKSLQGNITQSMDDSDAAEGDKDNPVHVDDRIRRTRTISLIRHSNNGKGDMTWDAGLTVYSAVGGYVFDDANYNNIQDIGIPLEGTKVVLYKYDDSGTPVYVAEQTVGSDGKYFFDFLDGGDYEVYFEFPEGYEAVVYGGGYKEEHYDSEVGFSFGEGRNSGRTTRFTLEEDEVQPYWDAGAYKYGALGDYVWFDVNKNGIQDKGEEPAAGVQVTLQRRYGPDGAWEYHKETTTDAKGYYWFDKLESGLDANWQYRVIFLPDDAYEVTKVMVGTDGTVDSDALHSYIEGWGYPTNAILLDYGQEDPTWDAGLIGVTAAIGDLIWFDNDRNGVQDREKEAGVDGVLVVLEYDINSFNTSNDESAGPEWREVAYEITRNGGYYDFLDLKQGYYRLNFYLPQNYDVTLLEAQDIASEVVGEAQAYKYDSDAIPNEDEVVFTDGHANPDDAMSSLGMSTMSAGVANFSTAASGIAIDPIDWANVNYPNGYLHMTRMVELQEERSDWSWDAGIYQPETITKWEYEEGEITTRTYGRGSVRTGDESMLWLWVILAAGAGVAIVFVLYRRKRAYGKRH